MFSKGFEVHAIHLLNGKGDLKAVPFNGIAKQLKTWHFQRANTVWKTSVSVSMLIQLIFCYTCRKWGKELVILCCGWEAIFVVNVSYLKSLLGTDEVSGAVVAMELMVYCQDHGGIN